MKRGDIVLVTAPGDYGKRRPAVVIQSDLFNDTHASIVVCPPIHDTVLTVAGWTAYSAADQAAMRLP